MTTETKPKLHSPYPDFPNKETVVPPTKRAFLGPYTSHIVKATYKNDFEK